ncbi:ATP synthase F1 subunit delta [Spirulina major CS-329]|jgi:F-type H+-transporting ATPase subunit delta|uniref:ATP synthase F1 subunit delta n=1 Tax=Spirulina TaxID=1154 RepID=UPI00232E6426|nr:MULTISPECIES: ATP synthase F1 subunit delta [Spirulina]MDB9495564.1 ATP synthase F1 subunit delta [Spirulina subsalsa CS-330]MDB9503915.1 ATP synthase F1 subunit delta [Spirulina major CS-329]
MTGSLVSSEIAEPYAQALMSLSQSRDITGYIGDEFRSLGQLLEESPELQDFITNPVIDDDDKKNVLRQILGDCDRDLLNFLMLLVDRRRIAFLPAVIEQYLTILRVLNKTVLAEVTIAQEPNDDQRHAIEDKVRQLISAESVELKIAVDASVLGGLIVRVGSQVFDASLRGQLRRIGMQLNV